jgi:hypothetical protein
MQQTYRGGAQKGVVTASVDKDFEVLHTPAQKELASYELPLHQVLAWAWRNEVPSKFDVQRLVESRKVAETSLNGVVCLGEGRQRIRRLDCEHCVRCGYNPKRTLTCTLRAVHRDCQHMLAPGKGELGRDGCGRKASWVIRGLG